MKITCAQDEKERLILTLINSDTCPFIDGRCDEDSICERCIENRIQWETEG